MEIKLKKGDSDLRFTAENGRGQQVFFDRQTADYTPMGVSPMEALLMSSAACAAMDFVSIMEKMQQEYSDFTAIAKGERFDFEYHKPFKSIHIEYHVTGTPDPALSWKALSLSIEKYCSVMETLRPDCEVTYALFIQDALINSSQKGVKK